MNSTLRGLLFIPSRTLDRLVLYSLDNTIVYSSYLLVSLLYHSGESIHQPFPSIVPSRCPTNVLASALLRVQENSLTVMVEPAQRRARRVLLAPLFPVSKNSRQHSSHGKALWGRDTHRKMKEE